MEMNSQFYSAVQGVLKSWTALQLAVSHGFGGSHSSEKAQWLVGVIENYFLENDGLEQWELEEFITQIMSEEFDLILEDDSISQVSQEIFTIHNLWSRNQLKELQERMQSLPQVNISECVAHDQENIHHNQHPTSSVDVSMEQMSSLSISKCETVVESTDENTAEESDTWTMVTRSRTKRK